MFVLVLFSCYARPRAVLVNGLFYPFCIIVFCAFLQVFLSLLLLMFSRSCCARAVNYRFRLVLVMCSCSCCSRVALALVLCSFVFFFAHSMFAYFFLQVFSSLLLLLFPRSCCARAVNSRFRVVLVMCSCSCCPRARDVPVLLLFSCCVRSRAVPALALVLWSCCDPDRGAFVLCSRLCCGRVVLVL